MFDLNLLDLNNINIEEINEVQEKSTKDIAIIGISVKLPMAENIEEYWQNIENGLDCISVFPKKRKKDIEDYLKFINGENHNVEYFNGAFLNEIDKFDYRFFRLTPKEASLTSPEQKLFMQTAFNAIEDSGYGGKKLLGSRTGVYMGLSDFGGTKYMQMVNNTEPSLAEIAVSGNFSAITPSRISYLLDFMGPSLCVNTACSSSLVAVHLACQGIRTGDCDMAIAGFSRLHIIPDKSELTLGIESTDGKTRSFDDYSDGTGIGEGVAALILKPLHKAIKDGDNVYAVIKGSAINQDGNSIGITAPNATSQADVIEKAWNDARVNPETIEYIEAHGTGTKLGDPIEIDGLERAFSKYTDKKQFCAINTVKSNMGHLFDGSGIAGLIKAVMALKNKKIPHAINFDKPNSRINFIESPVYINTEMLEWEETDHPRRCGVSSFGLSGTNCHIVLEEAPNLVAETEENNKDLNVLTLSGQSEDVLKHIISEYIKFIEKNKEINIDDFCYTANTGRWLCNCRIAIIFKDIEDLKNKLISLEKDDSSICRDGVFITISESLSDDFQLEENIRAMSEDSKKLIIELVNSDLRDKETLDQLCLLYISGANIEWEDLYLGKKRKKLRLPVYHFEKKRCWLSVPKVNENIDGNNYLKLMENSDLSEDLLEELNDVIEKCKSYLKQKNVDISDKNNKMIVLEGKENGNYTELELAIGKIWEELFGFEKININDNFYLLGGHSILMMQAITKIRKELKVSVSLNKFNENATISGLAQYISSLGIGHEKNIYEQTLPDVEQVGEPFTLTEVQMAYIMGRDTRYEIGGVSTHLYNEFEICLDIRRLNLSLNKVIKHHSMLRAIILPTGVQRILENVPEYKIIVEDLSELSEDEQQKRILSERNRMSHYIFKTDEWPLFEFKAFKLRDEQHYLFTSFDMLVMDGASLSIFGRDLMMFYNYPELNLSEIEFSFRDYMMAYERFKTSKTYLEDKEYWMRKVDTFPPAPVLPYKTSPSDVKEPHFKRHARIFNKEEWSILMKRAREHNITPSALLCTAYSKVLAFWSNQNRIAINLTVFNRYPFHEDVDKLIGDFTSLMLLDVDIKANASLFETAQGVQKTLLEDLEHRHYDGVEFIREISRYNNLGTKSAMPIVFTSILFNDRNDLSIGWEGLGKAKYGLSQTPQVHIDYQAVETNGTLSITWDYVDELFDAEMIDAMFSQYVDILERVIKNEEIDGVSIDDNNIEIINKFNSTAEDIKPTTLQSLFRNQAEINPENVAVIFEDEQLTYRELDKKSNQIARYLSELGIGRNDLVGVIGRRHPSTIVNIIGILKSGAAYVPIDPEYPEDRRNYIIDNSCCKYVLENEAYDKNNLSKVSDEGYYLEDFTDDIAYVIYTSGSTGKPKGVVTTHGAVINTIIDINTKFNVNKEDRIVGLSSMCFDLSVYDIFGALSTGAALVMIKDQRDIKNVREVMNKFGVTIWNSVPAIMDMLIDNMGSEYQEEEDYWNSNKDGNEVILSETNSSLRLVLLSGDWIPLNLPNMIVSHFPNTEVISLGGATEASIWSIYYPITEVKQEWKSIPYGAPMANQKFYVLNYNLEYCPIGVPGELCIGGVGLAKGYMADEEKTKAAFLNHPQLGKIYRTGDFGILHREGYIEFLGRRDQQVKIRGFRIELGEIENRLLEHPSVRNAVVIDRNDQNGKKYLCAYLVSDEELTNSELRAHIIKTLPEYMIPAYFVQVDIIPLTQNGKINRNSLPEPELMSEKEYVVPANDIEEKLAVIWQEVLGVELVGVTHSFFELGGNSVLMMQIIAKIGKELKAEISFRDFIERNTIRNIAEILDSKDNKTDSFKYTEITFDKENFYKEFPLTNIQIAYLMGREEQFEMGGVSTHFYVETETDIDTDRFNEALQKLIDRHPMLRAVVLSSGEQRILEKVPAYKIEVEDLRGMKEYEKRTLILNERERMSHFVFDSSQWPLFEFKAFKLEDNRNYYFVGIDMLIADGASLEIIFRELGMFCDNPQLELSEIECTFRDYMIAYNDFQNTETYKRDKEYWLNKLEEFPQAPQLPLKQDPSNVRKPKFKRKSYTLQRNEWNKIKSRAKINNVTPAALFCAVYADVLSYWSNQPHLAINSTVFNRYPFHKDVNKIVGDFTSVTLLDINIKPKDSIWKKVKGVQSTLVEALEHRHYDGVEFIRDISKHNNIGSNKAVMPIVFTSMLLGNSESGPGDINNSGKSEMSISQTSQVFLDHQIIEMNGGVSLTWDYVDDLFEPNLIENMFKQYIYALEGIAEDKEYSKELTEAEANLYKNYNNTAEEISKKTLHGMFIEQVEIEPENIAVIESDESFTYKELHNRSNQIANFLKEKGIGRGDYVGVITKRSLYTIANIIGILKAGAAYIPIDPNYPEERKNYILENSNCKYILIPEAYEENEMSSYSVELTCEIDNVEDVAYVIYTSGSTGMPKGVVVSHSAASNTIQDINRKYNVNKDDRIIGLSSMCFDLSVYDIFGALSSGASLVIIPDQRDVSNIAKAIEKYGITIWNSVPAIIEMLVENVGEASDTDYWSQNTDNMEFSYNYNNYESLRIVLLSGDWIPMKLTEKIRGYFENAEIVSLGGATEAAIWSIYHPINEVQDEWQSIPYGRPLSNQKFYVLNYELDVCPVGIAGELYIGGVGLAKEYLNDEEKTRNAFINHPFLGRIYKTGDYGVMHSEGYIEFIGRKDQQIKIRGYRVELGEIENRLLENENIKNAVVLDYKDDYGKRFLCAYIIYKNAIANLELKEYLLRKVPEYMVPSYFVEIDTIPLTPNGKIDRKALPKVDLSSSTGVEYVEPLSEIEKEIEEIWKQILDIEKIGINDNFFDLGGDSVLLIKMHTLLDKKYPGKIRVIDVFSNPTILKLSEFLKIDQESSSKIDLNFMSLPDKCFIEDSEEIENFEFNFQLKDEMFNKLGKIAEYENSSIADIMLSIYIYTIGQVSEKMQVEVQSMIDEVDTIHCIDLNIETIDDFSILVKAITEDKLSNNNKYSIRSLRNVSINKNHNSVAQLFYERNLLDSKIELSDFYDILFEMDTDSQSGQINFACKYNYAKLRKDAIEDIVNGYLQITQLIVKNY